MKRKAFKREKKRILRTLKDWSGPLGVNWWEIHPFFLTSDEWKLAEHGETDAANVTADWKYCAAIIHFNVPLCAQMCKDQLEHVIVHELCHILLNEMHADGTGHEERVVMTLERAFMWVRARALLNWGSK